MTHSVWIGAGAISGFISVAMGAFGAHILSMHRPKPLVRAFSTASEYQMYHAIALILFIYWLKQNSGASIYPAWAFLIGTVLFSGSLYLMVAFEARAFSAITPLGGLLLLSGWAVFAVSVFKR